MATVRLKNNSGRKVTDGEIVRIAPGTTDSFVVAKLTDFGIIGSVSGIILAGQTGSINLINTVDWNSVINKPTYLGTKITVSETPPLNPKTGDLWFW